MTTHNGPAAALATLIILQLVMLFALFTQTGPHPPNAVAPFAIAPFLSVSLSVAVMAILFGATNTSAGSATAVIAALLALSLMMRLLRSVSFTPYVIYRVILGVILLFIAYS